MSDVRLSVAAPCYNEAESIEAVVARWDEVLTQAPLSSEIVLCNDGSTDGTREVLKKYRDQQDIQVLLHETNQGKGAALKSGFEPALCTTHTPGDAG